MQNKGAGFSVAMRRHKRAPRNAYGRIGATGNSAGKRSPGEFWLNAGVQEQFLSFHMQTLQAPVLLRFDPHNRVLSPGSGGNATDPTAMRTVRLNPSRN